MKLVGVTAMSNVLGTLSPVRRLADAAHAAGALVLVDARPVRAPPRHRRGRAGMRLPGLHRPQDAAARPASACCGRARSCSRPCPPFLGGGEMIRDVRLDGWTPNELPWKFEAGTPPIAEAVGLRAADRLPRRARHGAGARARGGAHRLRAAHAHRAPRRRPRDLRPVRARRSGAA